MVSFCTMYDLSVYDLTTTKSYRVDVSEQRSNELNGIGGRNRDCIELLLVMLVYIFSV